MLHTELVRYLLDVCQSMRRTKKRLVPEICLWERCAQTLLLVVNHADVVAQMNSVTAL